MQATDAELVQLTRTGDTVAFGELIRRYQGLIYGLAYHQVGNFADAQDIAQEAFVKAFRCLDQLEQPERFAPWLKTVTANECKMWLRGRRRAMPLEEAEALPSYASLAAESWRRRERQTEIRQAVDYLPERSRLMITLHYLSGLSHREIGKFLGTPANAVAQHLYRARRQLKEVLTAKIEEDYAMNKLPESFTQDVLERVTLYPIVEGRFMTSKGEGDARGITMAIGEPSPKRPYITFWTREDDLDEIVTGTIPKRTDESAKGRALDSALEMLKAFGIELKRVVLRLSEGRKCRAAVELRRGKTEITLDMRPSDAMGLAVRVSAPIYAEEAVIKVGNVGEDDVSTPNYDMDPTAYNQEFQRLRQHDILTDKAWELGVSVEDLVDTVRFHKDEAQGVLRMWLEAIPEREVTFDLKEYAPGADIIFDLARRRGSTGLLKGGDPVRGFSIHYRYMFSMLDEHARMRIVQEAAEAQPKSLP